MYIMSLTLEDIIKQAKIDMADHDARAERWQEEYDEAWESDVKTAELVSIAENRSYEDGYASALRDMIFSLNLLTLGGYERQEVSKPTAQKLDFCERCECEIELGSEYCSDCLFLRDK